MSCEGDIADRHLDTFLEEVTIVLEVGDQRSLEVAARSEGEHRRGDEAKDRSVVDG